MCEARGKAVNEAGLMELLPCRDTRSWWAFPPALASCVRGVMMLSHTQRERSQALEGEEEGLSPHCRLIPPKVWPRELRWALPQEQLIGRVPETGSRNRQPESQLLSCEGLGVCMPQLPLLETEDVEPASQARLTGKSYR